MAKNVAYVVLSGRNPGVYTSWDACKAEVDGFSGAQYKGFGSLEAAQGAFKAKSFEALHTSEKRSKSAQRHPLVPQGHFVCCDAAYSHKTQELEWRVVEVVDDVVTEVHRSAVYQGGSANIGEFCGALDALVWMARHDKLHLRLYSDSKTAQAWIRNRKSNSGVAMSVELEKAFWDRCKALEAGKYDRMLETVTILDWKTKEWGYTEIPADFGRK